MINRAVLIGRLAKDPVLRKTQSGASVTSFTVACDRRSKQEGQPTADFINCVAWYKVADNVAGYMHKGSQIGVEGRIQTRSYDGKDGKKVFITEVLVESVQFLDTKSNTQQTETNWNQQEQSDELVIDPDDLPF